MVGKFFRVVCYADDIILLAPNRTSAQKMLQVCERFADWNNMKFSTHEDPVKSKSKAIFVTGLRKNVSLPLPLVLYDKPLPWVKHCDHLGNLITSTGSMDQDCRRKRAHFIDGSVKVKESFSFAHPCEVVTAVQKYCTSYHGSSLWRFESDTVEMINSSWQTSIKLAWDFPRNCRNYFIDQILAPNLTPPAIGLLSKFTNFYQSLLQSPSPEVEILAAFVLKILEPTQHLT